MVGFELLLPSSPPDFGLSVVHTWAQPPHHASRGAGFRHPLGLREDGRLHDPGSPPHAADALYEGEQALPRRPCDPSGWVSVEAGRRVLDPYAVARVQVGELRVGGVDV
eukprot:scaffold87780_cov28-Phaeocystis_antarctica.AAC.2